MILKRNTRRLKVKKSIKKRKPYTKKKIRDVLMLKSKSIPGSMGTDLVIGHNYDYSGGLECVICYNRKQQNPVLSIWDPQRETFDQYSLGTHLKEKHTIDEVVNALARLHWDKMTWGRR